MAYGESRISVIANFMFDLMVTNQDALGFADVWFGDQGKLPRTPALCIVPGNKARALEGAPLRTRVDYLIYLMVYHEAVQEVQTQLQETITLAEAVENLLHQDLSFGGNLQHSMVTNTEPGFAVRSRTVLRTTRITWEGFTVMVGATIT